MAADIWQTFRQPDFRTQSLQRRQFWIDQANVRQGNMPKVAVVTGKIRSYPPWIRFFYMYICTSELRGASLFPT